MTPPALLTFDIFGTVLDWRRGLREALVARGVNPEAAAGFGWFDAVVDAQGADEQEPPFRTYREITARSLVKVLGLTTVFVRRPHARPAPADLEVRDLVELAGRVEALVPRPGAPSPFEDPAARRG